jgi:preprotein translocase SecE subunit
LAEEQAKPKRRIRKTAPTIRERAEATQSKVEKKSEPSRIKPVLSKLKAPFRAVKQVKLPGAGRVPAPVLRLGRIILKVLRWLAPMYFINAWRELRQVTWPSRRETWRLSGAVFIFALVFGALVFGVDKVLDEIFKKVILK